LQRIVKLRFEPHDPPIARHIEDGFGLAGGTGWAREDPRSTPFRRIRGNDFTADDLGDALRILSGVASELRLEAESGHCPYPELPDGLTPVARVWRDGLMTTAARIDEIVTTVSHLVDEALCTSG